jgi:heme exporter protein B
MAESPMMTAPPGFFRSTFLVARKDLTIEFRTRSAFVSAAVFAVLSSVIFRFSWDTATLSEIDLAPGVLWVIFTFSGLLGLNRSFGVELADRGIDALLASPISRESVFAGKALANLVFVCGLQLLSMPALALFFNLPSGRYWLAVAGVIFLAAVGLVSIGTLFASMASNTRLAELLLPMLALPFFVPVVIPAAQASASLMAGHPVADVVGWCKVLLAFDIVFVAACTVAFPFTLEE